MIIRDKEERSLIKSGTKKNDLDRKQSNAKPEYIPPKIITYTKEDILEKIGPALACSPSPCAITP
jgi:hypothetical protein